MSALDGLRLRSAGTSRYNSPPPPGDPRHEGRAARRENAKARTAA